MPPDDLNGVDTSQLDALAKLEQDHRAIQTLATKALWRRDREIAIYSRVMADYDARMAAIAEQAKPIRQRVRDDLRKLDELYRDYQNALDHAKVKLQECDYRQEIGEFTAEQYQQCQQAAERAIAEREAEFEVVKKLKLRYLEVLPGEEPASEPAVATERGMSTVPSLESSVKSDAPARESTSATIAKTIYRPPPSPDDFKVPEPANASAGSHAYQTVAVSPAMLVEDRDGLPGTPYRLGALTSIGRTQDNQIVVPAPEVSRRHAQIVLTDGGTYVLKDLGSPNGTFINGQRITEQPLHEGDRVTLANQSFFFTRPS